MEDVAKEYMSEIQQDTMRKLKKQKIEQYNKDFGTSTDAFIKQSSDNEELPPYKAFC